MKNRIQILAMGIIFMVIPGWAGLRAQSTITLQKGRVFTADTLAKLYKWDGKMAVKGPADKVIFELEKLIDDKDRIFIQEDPAIIFSPTGTKCWVGGVFSLGNLQFSGYVELRGSMSMSISGPGPFSPPNTPTRMGIVINEITAIRMLSDTKLTFPGMAAAPVKNVKDAQLKLQKLGYDPGPADGKMGQKTAAAISAFQKDNQLKTTGTLDAKTLEVLSGK